jgi:hypothetical protein
MARLVCVRILAFRGGGNPSSHSAPRSARLPLRRLPSPPISRVAALKERERNSRFESFVGKEFPSWTGPHFCSQATRPSRSEGTPDSSGGSLAGIELELGPARVSISFCLGRARTWPIGPPPTARRRGDGPGIPSSWPRFRAFLLKTTIIMGTPRRRASSSRPSGCVRFLSTERHLAPLSSSASTIYGECVRLAGTRTSMAFGSPSLSVSTASHRHPPWSFARRRARRPPKRNQPRTSAYEQRRAGSTRPEVRASFVVVAFTVKLASPSSTMVATKNEHCDDDSDGCA